MKTQKQNPIAFFVPRLLLIATCAMPGATVLFAAQSGQPGTIENIVNTQLSYPLPSSITSGTESEAASAQDSINNIYGTGALPASTASTSGQRNHVAAAAVSTTDARTLATVPSSPLVTPYGLALDSSGNLFVADSGANAIWKITNDSQIALLAGDTAGASGSTDGKGTAARFDFPTSLVVRSGTLYVTDCDNNTIRAISPDGTVRTLAGSPNFIFTGTYYCEGTGTKAAFDTPAGIAIDGSGKLYVADSGNGYIRKLTATGVTSWLAGEYHWHLIYDDYARVTYGGGALYLTGTTNINFFTNATYLVSSSLVGSSVTSGTYTLLNSATMSLNGDGSASAIYSSGSLALIGTNIADVLTPASLDNYISSGTFTIGSYTFADVTTLTVDGTTFTPNVILNGTTSTTTETQNAPIVSEPRVLDATTAHSLSQIITTATETYTSGSYFFDSLFGMAVSPDGNYLYACNGNPSICAIKISNGTVIPLDTAIFGSGINPLRPASPDNLRFDSQGNLYIADASNSRILKVSATDSTVSCLAGGGTPDADGNYQSGYQDGPAATALFNAPTDIAIDSAGNIYVADSGNSLIRKIDANGNVTTLVLQEVALSDLAPSTTPSTADTSANTSEGSSGSSGGGAPSALYLLALATLAVTRLLRKF